MNLLNAALADNISNHQPAYFFEPIIAGNKCGHNPRNPQFFEPSENHRLRPDVIQWAIQNLKKFYVEPANWLYSLQVSRCSSRQERSEGRERDADVLGVLLHYTELASLRVGIPKENGEFISLDMRFIAKVLGWRHSKDDAEDKERLTAGVTPRHRGIKRVWRSIAALKNAGYLTVHRQYKKCFDDEQEYIGLPSIRCIKAKLFDELGISIQKLRSKRDQAAKRVKRKYGHYKKKMGTKFQQTLFATKLTTSKGSNPIKRLKQAESRVINHVIQEKQRQEQCYQLRQLPENKELSAQDFYAKFPQLKSPG